MDSAQLTVSTAFSRALAFLHTPHARRLSQYSTAKINVSTLHWELVSARLFGSSGAALALLSHRPNKASIRLVSRLSAITIPQTFCITLHPSHFLHLPHLPNLFHTIHVLPLQSFPHIPASSQLNLCHNEKTKIYEDIVDLHRLRPKP